MEFEYPTELIESLVDLTIRSGDKDAVKTLTEGMMKLCHERPLAEVMTAFGICLAAYLTKVDSDANKALLPFVVITIAERYSELDDQ